ncbi:MAG: SPOR domain-containing protein [Alphaproteobacteria bacterium]
MSRYDDDDDSFERPSGGSERRVGSSSIAYESPQRKPGRRRLITGLVVVLAIGGFIGIVWHAYNQGKAGGGDGVVPVIKAEDSPTRVRPDQPGGMDVPNQDKLIYERLAPGSQMAAPQVERLLPPAEAPVARPQAPAPVPPPQAPQAAAPTDLQPPPLGERQVTTAPPSNSVAPQAVPSQPPIPVAPPAPSQAVPPSQAPQQAVQAPRPTPAPAPAAQSIPAGAARVQLGAVRSADAAQKEWARLQNAHKDLLGGLSMNVVTADLGERGIYYRIQAGPAADAADLCAKLKARNVGCIVVR